MNIQEALQSKEKFKRPCHKAWFTHYCQGALIYNESSEYIITDEDLMADDWTLFEEPVTLTLTKGEFLSLWAESQKEAYSMPGHLIRDTWDVYPRAFNILMKRLGF